MSKIIELNNVDFELGKPINGQPSINTRSIWDCYDKPSKIKEEIYEEWRNWFVRDCDSYLFGVCSYNGHFFTINGLITVNEKTYYLVITRSHNRAYEIV